MEAEAGAAARLPDARRLDREFFTIESPQQIEQKGGGPGARLGAGAGAAREQGGAPPAVANLPRPPSPAGERALGGRGAGGAGGVAGTAAAACAMAPKWQRFVCKDGWCL